MSSKFYASIISENEQGIEITELKKASREVSAYYRSSTSKEGLTPPDYNSPAYRCAYLYKYASLHTGIANKYFRKMLQKKEVKNILYRNRKIKICCLGGGPGTEVVGILKAMALFPTFHKQVAKVSVLDACQGWKDTFHSIMSNLIGGKDEQLPNTFLSGREFKDKFIQVDLQDTLSKNVRKVISTADIICIMRLHSELSTERSMRVLKVLGDLFKTKALILYIDNFKDDSSESIDFISRFPEFKVVLGPLDNEKFVRQATNSNIATYGCIPHTHARIFAIGWIKISQTINGYDASVSASYSSLTDVGNIETESEIKDHDILTNLESEIKDRDILTNLESEIKDHDILTNLESEIKDHDILTNLDEKREDKVYDKYTQTEEDASFKNEVFKSAVEVELAALMEALTHLLTVIERLILK